MRRTWMPRAALVIAAVLAPTSPMAAAVTRTDHVSSTGATTAATTRDGADDVYRPGPISSSLVYDNGLLFPGDPNTFDRSRPVAYPNADLASMSETVTPSTVTYEARLRGSASLRSKSWSSGNSQIVWQSGLVDVTFSASGGRPKGALGWAIVIPCSNPPKTGYFLPPCSGPSVNSPFVPPAYSCGVQATSPSPGVFRVAVPRKCFPSFNEGSTAPIVASALVGWIRYDDLDGGTGLHADVIGAQTDRYVALVRDAQVEPGTAVREPVGISWLGAVEQFVRGRLAGTTEPYLDIAPTTRIVGAASADVAVRSGYTDVPFRTWLATADGGVYTWSAFFGSMGGRALAAPIVAIAATPSGNGYWLVGADGGVFAFGDARYAGGLGRKPSTSPVVGITATRSGKGYWLANADGKVYAFGDARDVGGLTLTTSQSPVVAIAATPSGNGYWLVRSDGAVSAFGTAESYGDLASTRLNAPVTSIAVTESGKGYWLGAANGGIFAYGDAK